MNLIHTAQNFIDGCIGLFSPKRALKRQYLRKIQRRKYDGAYDYGGGRPWTNAGTTTANQEVISSWQEVTNRVRMLDRDSSLMKRAVKVHIDHVVNTGITLEMRLKKPNGDLDTKLNDQIERDFRKFCKQIDVSGRLHYQDMERLAERQICHAGGCLFVKVYPKNKKDLLVPFQIQAYELDWLDKTKDSIASSQTGYAIENGIKYNIVTGEIISFFLRKQFNVMTFDSVEIPASSVIYYMHPERFGQLLPISPFTAGLQTNNTFSGYIDSEYDRAYAAAQTAAIVESDPDTGGYPGKKKDGTENIEIDGLAIEYLNPGERMNFNNTPNLGSSFRPFIDTNYEIQAQSTNTPLEKLTMNFDGLNYSVARTSNNEYEFSKAPDFDIHIRFFSNPVVEEFFRVGALSGMRLPGYFQNPDRYMEAVNWRRPHQPALDPIKDSRAAADNLKNGLDSPQNIMRQRGLDPEKIIRERAEAEKLFESLGMVVDWNQTSSAVATSPSKLENQK